MVSETERETYAFAFRDRLFRSSVGSLFPFLSSFAKGSLGLGRGRILEIVPSTHNGVVEGAGSFETSKLLYLEATTDLVNGFESLVNELDNVVTVSKVDSGANGLRSL
jgi:hypothetical protein